MSTLDSEGEPSVFSRLFSGDLSPTGPGLPTYFIPESCRVGWLVRPGTQGPNVTSQTHSGKTSRSLRGTRWTLQSCSRDCKLGLHTPLTKLSLLRLTLAGPIMEDRRRIGVELRRYILTTDPRPAAATSLWRRTCGTLDVGTGPPGSGRGPKWCSGRPVCPWDCLDQVRVPDPTRRKVLTLKRDPLPPSQVLR